ncbi:MAG: hypothetical protein HYX47_02620 [Burkholderiales bacterium]|nr:hypothetical protein [Burkholderiales bacterium]
MSLELPVLRLGLVGFAPAQQEQLGNLLKARVVKWQPWPFADADAWWVNGANAKRQPNGIVRVPPADPKSRATLLNLEQVDRPMAFALPLAGPDIEPPASFDPARPESIAAALQKFETALAPLGAQFALACAIEQRQGKLTSAIYHLSVRGALVAVIDLGGAVGHAPGVQPADVEQAEWSGRPAAAGLIPPHFTRTTMTELMWQYALRTTRDVLPARYRTAQLYFRHSPRVPGRMLKDTHLALIRELAIAPGTFAELQQRTGLGESSMAHALTALFFAGSVTSNRQRAAPPRGGKEMGLESAGSRHSIVPSMMDSALRSDPAAVRGDRHADQTAPAPLWITE